MRLFPALAVGLVALLLGASFAATRPPEPKPVVVTVKRGEHLTLLARRHGTTVRRLVELNGLRTTVLRVGQRLLVRPPPPSVALETGWALGVPVRVVRVNLGDPKVFVTPLLPPRGLGTGIKLDALANGSSAVALVNGGYFHPTSYIPTGDLVVRGKQVFSGKVRTAVAITPDNRVVVRAAAMNSLVSWRGFETVIANGPYVLRKGKVAAYPQAEGYRDAAVWGRAPRSAVGIVSDRKLFFMSTRQKLTLSELAKVMRALGAKEAITLDGGSSVGMAWKGKVLIRPKRLLSYGIAVYVNYPRERRLGR